MPTYDYECTSCAHRFELRRSINDTSPVSCPRCGSPTHQIFSSVPIIFKGSGFYVTDHRNPDYSSPPNAAAGAPKQAETPVPKGDDAPAPTSAGESKKELEAKQPKAGNAPGKKSRGT